jgi:ABC-type uncharacterized transport system permease subunit
VVLVEFHQLAAAIYLAAGIGALVGVVLPAPNMSRGAAVVLAMGALAQTVGFATLHGSESPPITSLPVVLALSAWMTVLFVMLLTWKVRLPGLAAVVGPLAFLSVFVASLGLKVEADPSAGEAGAWPHVHVLLASGGIALLGIAGLAGLVYLLEHRRLKAKPPVAPSIPLPSLEALDRVNVVTTAVGFALLTLGIVTGMIWLKNTLGTAWTGTTHEAWMVISWAIYAGLVGARYAGRQGARQAAASALAGFAFLLFGVMGVGVLS